MWRKKRDSEILRPSEEEKRRRLQISYESEGGSGSTRSLGENYWSSTEVDAESEEELRLSRDNSYECIMSGHGNERPTSPSDVPIISGCDLKEFERVVARTSNDRIVEIEEMGFGPVHIIRGVQLNVELCKMLLANFDVKNSTIKIHGRNLSIAAKDVKCVMGLRCRGCEVDINCLGDDEILSELKRKICGEDSDISLKKLRRMVLTTHDDDELWKVCFALYALAIVFCPSRPGHVDPRLLVPLKNPALIRTHNWADFVFRRLVDGVNAYQSGEPIHVGGCLIFLQLFYLSVLRERMFIYPKVCLPTMSWGQNECDRMYDRIENLGGYYATEGVWVSKRGCDVRSTEYSGSRDYSTGLKTNLVDDLGDLKSDMGDVQDEVAMLVGMMHNVFPDILHMRKALTTIQIRVAKLRTEEGMSELVRKVRNNVVLKLKGSCTDMGRGSDNDLGDKHCEEALGRTNTGDFTKEAEIPRKRRIFRSINDLSPMTRDLMVYLFSRKDHGDKISSRHEIGRCGDLIVCRRDLKCLSPEKCINGEIINMMGALSFAKSVDCWFLPTIFSEHAKDLGSNPEGTSTFVPLQIVMRFLGRLHECQQIFIPIHDGPDEHWFLAVLKLVSGHCEIWDSNHDRSNQERRVGYAKLVIGLIESVFAEELQASPELALKLSSCSFIYPHVMGHQKKKEESGIYVIRNMQYYRERWYEGFNTADQRVRIAVEIVNHSCNECADDVWANVYREKKEREAEAKSSQHKAAECVPGVTSIPLFSQKFKPRIPRRG